MISRMIYHYLFLLFFKENGYSWTPPWTRIRYFNRKIERGRKVNKDTVHTWSGNYVLQWKRVFWKIYWMKQYRYED